MTTTIDCPVIAQLFRDAAAKGETPDLREFLIKRMQFRPMASCEVEARLSLRGVGDRDGVTIDIPSEG